MATRRRDLTPIEAPHLPQTLQEVVALEDRFRELGFTPSLASGAAAWGGRKALGLPDVTSQATRAKYRKMFAALEVPGPRVVRAVPGAVVALGELAKPARAGSSGGPRGAADKANRAPPIMSVAPEHDRYAQIVELHPPSPRVAPLDRHVYDTPKAA